MKKTSCIRVYVLRDQPDKDSINTRLLANIIDSNRYVAVQNTDLTEQELDEVNFNDLYLYL